MPFCPVCRSAGKTEEEYTSHYVRETPSKDAKVVCPILLARKCHVCGVNGHTPKYCPQSIRQEEKQEQKTYGVPLFKKEGKKKMLVDVVYGQEEQAKKSSTSSVRLFIGEEEMTIEEQTTTEETKPLSLELKTMKSKKINKTKKAKNTAGKQGCSNKFACLDMDTSSESETEEHTVVKTPIRKSFASVAAPNAPARNRNAYKEKSKTLKPVKLNFEASARQTLKGAWGKTLTKHIEERDGGLEKWKKTQEKKYDVVVEERKKVMSKKLHDMIAQCEAMKKEIQQQKVVKKLEEDLKQVLSNQEEANKTEVTDYSKYQDMDWGDMVEMEC